MTNILLSFLTTARADSKRFEMLALLSTILGWDDSERERAGLQRGAKGKAALAPRRAKKSAEDEAADAAMNESFSNLFVEFLLKEASHGQDSSSPSTPVSPLNSMRSPPPMSPALPSGTSTPTPRGTRTMSSSSLASDNSGSRVGVARKPSYGLQEALGR